MSLTFSEIDGQPVAVVETEEDYHEAVEVLGVPVIFAEDPLMGEKRDERIRELRWLIDLVVGEGLFDSETERAAARFPGGSRVWNAGQLGQGS